MFKLYGFAISNHYNMVKLALREKGLPFERCCSTPARAPRHWPSALGGKVPVLEVGQIFISETSVNLAQIVGDKLFGIDFLAEMPEARALLERLEQRPHARHCC